MIFVDTGAWFAAFVPTDPDHPVASIWLAENQEPLVTTDYVVDELLTLMKARGELRRAVRLGGMLISGVLCHLEWVQEVDFDRAWSIYSTYQDKGWSFTDCASRAVMERLWISVAFAFDQHFHQFGTVSVVP